ncbi:hypothetical protein E2C01_098266 [Portunus trituberculatus]|uniref:Uncharacterized protein n=1 Tax=Portunus trituberculatus TaxID=210409 RepID=A0A5B7KCH1_PORTR|nr:hypothetical protein [Portunus trituberculatus]
MLRGSRKVDGGLQNCCLTHITGTLTPSLQDSVCIDKSTTESRNTTKFIIHFRTLINRTHLDNPDACTGNGRRGGSRDRDSDSEVTTRDEVAIASNVTI